MKAQDSLCTSLFRGIGTESFVFKCVETYMYYPLPTPTHTQKKMLTKISCSVLQWECLSDSALTLGWLP